MLSEALLPLRRGGGSASMTAAYSALPERLPLPTTILQGLVAPLRASLSLRSTHYRRVSECCDNLQKPRCAMYAHHEHNLFNRSAARPFRITHSRSARLVRIFIVSDSQSHVQPAASGRHVRCGSRPSILSQLRMVQLHSESAQSSASRTASPRASWQNRHIPLPSHQTTLSRQDRCG